MNTWSGSQLLSLNRNDLLFVENSLSSQRQILSFRLSLFQSFNLSDQVGAQCILLTSQLLYQISGILIHEVLIHSLYTKSPLNTSLTFFPPPINVISADSWSHCRFEKELAELFQSNIYVYFEMESKLCCPESRTPGPRQSPLPQPPE